MILAGTQTGTAGLNLITFFVRIDFSMANELAVGRVLLSAGRDINNAHGSLHLRDMLWGSAQRGNRRAGA